MSIFLTSYIGSKNITIVMNVFRYIFQVKINYLFFGEMTKIKFLDILLCSTVYPNIFNPVNMSIRSFQFDFHTSIIKNLSSTKKFHCNSSHFFINGSSFENWINWISPNGQRKLEPFSMWTWLSLMNIYHLLCQLYQDNLVRWIPKKHEWLVIKETNSKVIDGGNLEEHSSILSNHFPILIWNSFVFKTLVKRTYKVTEESIIDSFEMIFDSTSNSIADSTSK